jgi:hypothetical protein
MDIAWVASDHAMFPIRDYNPHLSVPWVTYGIVAINVTV